MEITVALLDFNVILFIRIIIFYLEIDIWIKHFYYLSIT